jgi:thioesterase domain-containing protein
MVAYEMASQLKREYNETVAMVFMVDTLPWFPKALTNCTEYNRKCGEEILKSMGKLVVNILLPVKLMHNDMVAENCQYFFRIFY